ncbi:MAG: hypothetical protein FJW64_16495, partial [Actinobacteria bacterium]|nr:hypothetical protein [Actinomycetota bacterium]
MSKLTQRLAAATRNHVDEQFCLDGAVAPRLAEVHEQLRVAMGELRKARKSKDPRQLQLRAAEQKLQGLLDQAEQIKQAALADTVTIRVYASSADE